MAVVVATGRGGCHHGRGQSCVQLHDEVADDLFHLRDTLSQLFHLHLSHFRIFDHFCNRTVVVEHILVVVRLRAPPALAIVKTVLCTGQQVQVAL